MNNSILFLANVTDGVITLHNIVNVWKSDWGSIQLSRSNKKYKYNLKSATYQKDIELTGVTLRDYLCHKKDKSCSLDAISLEHLKICTDVIISLLSMSFTSLIVHRILPKSIIYVELVPIFLKRNC